MNFKKNFKFFSDCKICTDKKFFMKNKCKECNKYICKNCIKHLSCCPFCKNENFGNKSKEEYKQEMFFYHNEENLRLGLEEAIRLHEELNGQTVEETNKEFTYEEQVEITRLPNE